jgi:hypothetical protein
MISHFMGPVKGVKIWCVLWHLYNVAVFLLEEDANYHLSTSNFFPYVEYVLLKCQHVSVIQDHLQGCTVLKGNFTIYIYVK